VRLQLRDQLGDMLAPPQRFQTTHLLRLLTRDSSSLSPALYWTSSQTTGGWSTYLHRHLLTSGVRGDFPHRSFTDTADFLGPLTALSVGCVA